MGSDNGKQPWALGDSNLGASLVVALQTGYSLEALRHRLEPLNGTEWGRIVTAVGKAEPEDRSQVLDFCIMELPPENFGNRHPDETEDLFRHLITLASRPERRAEFLGADSVLLRREQRPRCNAEDVLNIFGDIKWLWEDWIPRGFLSCVAGRPGVGKSGVMLDLVARSMMAGEFWPDGTKRVIAPKSPRIMWIDCEQMHQLLFVRMKSWGISPKPFVWPVDLANPENKFPRIRLDESAWLQYIFDLILDERPHWVIIDSLRSSFAGDENSSEVQGMLDRMQAVCRDTAGPITYSHHVRKGQRENDEQYIISEDSLRGSGAIMAAFKSVMGIDKPDANDERFRFRVLKTNLTKKPDAVGLTMGEEGRPEWSEFSPASHRRETSADRAAEFLRICLESGEKDAQEVFEGAADDGHSKKSLYAAKRGLGVINRRVGFGPESRSVWRLP